MTPKTYAPAKPRATKRDYRLAALLAVTAGTVALGYLVSLMPGRGVTATSAAPPSAASPAKPGLSALPATPAEARRAAAEEDPEPEELPVSSSKATDPKAEETKKILKETREKIRAKRYDEAIAFLHAAREQVQHDPRSYMTMARALEGKGDYSTARDFYAAAVDKDPYLADAYFGFATASEALGDLEAAIGGMRNFLHVQPKPDPERLKIVQARSAIWEWESKLGRGAWGPTKGIPPGFTAEELKRDGRGVGIKMPIPGTEQPDGSRKYEIKHQDKFKLFKP
ncbi:MAG: hypothetical protein ACM34A_20320 [Bacillota bacterium]